MEATSQGSRPVEKQFVGQNKYNTNKRTRIVLVYFCNRVAVDEQKGSQSHLDRLSIIIVFFIRKIIPFFEKRVDIKSVIL